MAKRRNHRSVGRVAAGVSAVLFGACYSDVISSAFTVMWPLRSGAAHASSFKERSSRVRCNSAAIAEAEVETETESVGLIQRPDMRKAPWEILQTIYQSEARRCWGKRPDGKIRGFIADFVTTEEEEADESPFEVASFSRKWKAVENEDIGDEVIDPYRTLAIERDATPTEIKKAYLAMARACHPDRGGDPALFVRCLKAYQVLKDESRKGHYDKHGADAGDIEQQKIVRVRVPDLEVLRKGVQEHGELSWSPSMTKLAGMTGEVQFALPKRLLTQAQFHISDTEDVVVWLPTHVLVNIDEDGKERVLEDLEKEGLVWQASGALVEYEKYQQVQIRAITYYAGGWQEMEGQKATPMRDACFAASFFKREGEEKQSVLDLGCGAGAASHIFAKNCKFGLIYALDIDKSELQSCRDGAEIEEIAPERGYFLVRSDAYALPFKDQLIDNVWWGMGWTDYENPTEVLSEIFRVLGPGGKVAISTKSGFKVSKEIQDAMDAMGFEETRIYPPRARVFLNYGTKPR
eukprot:TRINITY_DN110899_c0_g1_i1.p1 TRINITY_DN110899_c0_g1~~TRINITY_DN110899_c0_g1_i1.p1  ORF type:complete len:520 (-),score=108.11 TRINITY_DN110899_c0_g1_i1:22-1581(-)